MTAPNRMASANSRDKIFDEGARQFKEYGYRATTNVTIANAIDVSPTMINHFFKSKAGLYREIFGHGPLTEDQGRRAAMLLSALLNAIRDQDPIVSMKYLPDTIEAAIDDLGIRQVGFAPKHLGESDLAYVCRQVSGITKATEETPSCDICRGFFWKDDLVVRDLDLGTTHLACNGGPVVNLETGDPIEGVAIEVVAYKYGEGGL